MFKSDTTSKQGIFTGCSTTQRIDQFTQKEIKDEAPQYPHGLHERPNVPSHKSKKHPISINYGFSRKYVCDRS